MVNLRLYVMPLHPSRLAFGTTNESLHKPLERYRIYLICELSAHPLTNRLVYTLSK